MKSSKYDITMMPIIGKIKVKGLTYRDGDGVEHTTEPCEEEVVGMVGDDIYVLNKWYVEDVVPQLRHKEMVEEFIPAQEI